MDKYVKANGLIMLCCADEENMRELPPDPERPQLIIKQCNKCDRKHYVFNAPPIRLGVQGGKL